MKKIILSFLLFANTSFAVDFTVTFKTAENSVSDTEVSSISSSKFDDFFSSVSTIISEALNNYVSSSDIKVPTMTILKDVGLGTYNTPAGTKYLKIKLVGGGSGGSGTSIGPAPYPGNGTQTRFSNLLLANGGTGNPNLGPANGVINPPAQGHVIRGEVGGGKFYNGSSGIYVFGNSGASNKLGHGMLRVSNSNASYPGIDALPNTGAGGSGSAGGGASDRYGGSGGGSGAYIEATIMNPESSYEYYVGQGGLGSPGLGVNTFAGGNGGSGIIIIEEHYQ